MSEMNDSDDAAWESKVWIFGKKSNYRPEHSQILQFTVFVSDDVLGLLIENRICEFEAVKKLITALRKKNYS